MLLYVYNPLSAERPESKTGFGLALGRCRACNIPRTSEEPCRIGGRLPACRGQHDLQPPVNLMIGAYCRVMIGRCSFVSRAQSSRGQGQSKDPIRRHYLHAGTASSTGATDGM